jgi:hypothetical protein
MGNNTALEGRAVQHQQHPVQRDRVLYIDSGPVVMNVAGQSTNQP